ncbi:MAG: radical SAM protein [Gammaproteobacteria bacterium]|nr:radical SAM protein [Gammaproteobacteria bacterium]
MPGITTVLKKAALVNLLPSDLMDPNIPLSRARELFVEYVDQVEIENHAFCNRVCWFCPNRFIDRRSSLRRMKDAVFSRIIGDLSQVDYRGALTWSRYHEVLADDRVYERMEAARRALPEAELVVISNGDYMDRSTLGRLEACGIDRLMLDLYLPEGRERDPACVDDGLRKFAGRTGLVLEQSRGLSFRIRGTPMKATLDVVQYDAADLSTRGGLLDLPKRDVYSRRAVCLAPVRHLAIDYNGKAMLCCQTRSDAREHAPAIIGDLADPGYGIFHYYRDLGRARRGLLAPGCKGGVCATCDVRDDGPDRLARRRPVAAVLERMPGAEALSARFWRRTVRRRFAPTGRRTRRPADPA